MRPLPVFRHLFQFLNRAPLLLVLLMMSACASTGDPSPAPADPEAKEIKAKDAIDDSGGPEGDLIAEAKQLYEAGMYSLAQEKFQSIKDRFPLGAYGQFSELKVGDCYYFNGEYNEAAKFYEGYLKSHPGSPDSPYIELQGARAHVQSAGGGTGRDRQPLERALALFDGVVERYPGSAYASAAERERGPVVEQLAAYDQLIIDFYKQRGNTAAVEAREKLFAERWSRRLVRAEVQEKTPETPLDELPTLSQE
jgi:outer membrane protein assembly factor BamD